VAWHPGGARGLVGGRWGTGPWRRLREASAPRSTPGSGAGGCLRARKSNTTPTGRRPNPGCTSAAAQSAGPGSGRHNADGGRDATTRGRGRPAVGGAALGRPLGRRIGRAAKTTGAESQRRRWRAEHSLGGALVPAAGRGGGLGAGRVWWGGETGRFRKSDKRGPSQRGGLHSAGASRAGDFHGRGGGLLSKGGATAFSASVGPKNAGGLSAGVGGKENCGAVWRLR